MAVLRKYYELAGFAVEGGNFSYVVTSRHRLAIHQAVGDYKVRTHER